MPMKPDARPVAIITGACGGMGQACARQLGLRYRLALTDVDEARLRDQAEALERAGFGVAAVIAGDVGDPSVIQALVDRVREAGPFRAMAHTAGLSPALAGWDSIILTNLVATEQLLRAVEPLLIADSVVVMIASNGAHLRKGEAEVDAILDEPLAEDFLQRILPHILRLAPTDTDRAVSGVAYALAKRAVIRMAEQRALAWGALGARIVTISPGMTFTPMGRKEAEVDKQVAGMLAGTPLGRWGTGMDIANAVDFLVSDLASFITGCDLRVDGGMAPAFGARF